MRLPETPEFSKFWSTKMLEFSKFDSRLQQVYFNRFLLLNKQECVCWLRLLAGADTHFGSNSLAMLIPSSVNFHAYTVLPETAHFRLHASGTMLEMISLLDECHQVSSTCFLYGKKPLLADKIPMMY
ncbi:MAG TPA: hypothetical protein VMY59_06450 [Candidatus Thermoplasmatota archaeon]|nr:hypothetical protein [Candidatus Thermoplasmatota archaeon]